MPELKEGDRVKIVKAEHSWLVGKEATFEGWSITGKRKVSFDAKNIRDKEYTSDCVVKANERSK